jgi:hypothetical protein
MSVSKTKYSHSCIEFIGIIGVKYGKRINIVLSLSILGVFSFLIENANSSKKG